MKGGKPQIFSSDQVGREARISIRGQRQRCNNPNASDFQHYGGKGVKVCYDSKEFFNWFKKHRKKIPLNIKVNVDRIDHDGNYCFSNIRLITKRQNVIESNKRRSRKKKNE